MIGALATLFVFQLAGEVLVRAFDLPFPGPVLGMLLLFVTLKVRGSLPQTLQQTSQTMLSHLSLLFVPAGVGVMRHFDLIAQEWVPILITILLSTLLTIGITALTMCWMVRRVKQ
jgi:holin-like protein